MIQNASTTRFWLMCPSIFSSHRTAKPAASSFRNTLNSMTELHHCPPPTMTDMLPTKTLRLSLANRLCMLYRRSYHARLSSVVVLMPFDNFPYIDFIPPDDDSMLPSFDLSQEIQRRRASSTTRQCQPNMIFLSPQQLASRQRREVFVVRIFSIYIV